MPFVFPVVWSRVDSEYGNDPQDLENVYRINGEELLVALKQCALMTTKERNSVRFSFGETEATLFGHASNVGESGSSSPWRRFPEKRVILSISILFI